jgi:hypothetical protein
VLVFDNFQNLPKLSPLHDLIEPLLLALPVIFLSRTQAPPTIADITTAPLLLTSEEALAISKQFAPKRVTGEEIVALNERSGG